MSLLIFALVFAAAAHGSGRGFRTQDLLRDHYSRYGSDFGRISQGEYLHMAQLLRDSRPGRMILEAKRSGGGGSKFDRKRGWYVAYEADGTIRTFFIPKQGIHYFELQARGAIPPDR